MQRGNFKAQIRVTTFQPAMYCVYTRLSCAQKLATLLIDTKARLATVKPVYSPLAGLPTGQKDFRQSMPPPYIWICMSHIILHVVDF